MRAVFDNSSFVIPGEDVKVAGVKVGTIQSVELTTHNKAALVLEIDDRRFEPFRADAHCEIGLESLLGEQFVQCTPTQPRAPGAPRAAARCRRSHSGPDKGQHLLPVQNTTTPVGIDLIADITRLPQQQRLQLIIAGLGAGLAGNGQELNAALLRADPALQQTDRVIAVLAEPEPAAGPADRPSPTGSSRRSPPSARTSAGFVQHVGAVAVAAAAPGGRRSSRTSASFPPFLRQLTPAAAAADRAGRAR